MIVTETFMTTLLGAFACLMTGVIRPGISPLPILWLLAAPY